MESKKKFQAAKAKFDGFPAELHFVNFPVPDEYFVADELVEGVCREIESRIREGKVRGPVLNSCTWLFRPHLLGVSAPCGTLCA